MKALFFGIILFSTAGPAAGPAPAQVAVVANKSVPVTSIDNRTLLDLYTGDVKTWSSGERVVLTDLKPRGAVKDSFYEFLGMSASRLKSIWMKNMLSGEGDPPASFASEDEMLARVAGTPGAIGYVSIAKAREARAAGAAVVTLLEIPEIK
jgi:ABC-type phosphate transport system substrate-binding protein